MTPDGKNDMILSVPAYLPGRYAGCADMAELADATVLGAVFERSAGSSPVIRIKKAKMMVRSFSPFCVQGMEIKTAGNPSDAIVLVILF